MNKKLAWNNTTKRKTVSWLPIVDPRAKSRLNFLFLILILCVFRKIKRVDLWQVYKSTSPDIPRKTCKNKSSRERAQPLRESLHFESAVASRESSETILQIFRSKTIKAAYTFSIRINVEALETFKWKFMGQARSLNMKALINNSFCGFPFLFLKSGFTYFGIATAVALLNRVGEVVNRIENMCWINTKAAELAK